MKFALGVAFLFLFAVVVHQSLKPREPSYGGHPFSYWVKQYRQPNRNSISEQLEMAEVDDAIRHIGTNAIPTLLEMLQTQDSKFKRAAIDFLNRQSLVRLDWQSSAEKHVIVTRVFEVLGSDAKPAVPGLLTLLTNDDVQVKHLAAEELCHIGPAAREAVPVLIQCLKADSNGVARLLEVEVYSLDQGRSVVYRFPGGFYRDSGCYLRILAAIGPDAREAVQVILPLPTNADSSIRDAAHQAIQKIAPEATNGPPSNLDRPVK